MSSGTLMDVRIARVAIETARCPISWRDRGNFPAACRLAWSFRERIRTYTPQTGCLLKNKGQRFEPLESDWNRVSVFWRLGVFLIDGWWQLETFCLDQNATPVSHKLIPFGYCGFHSDIFYYSNSRILTWTPCCVKYPFEYHIGAKSVLRQQFGAGTSLAGAGEKWPNWHRRRVAPINRTGTPRTL